MKIDDIKILIPDYITGSLNKDDIEIVENAIKSNPDISDLYNEMKSAFNFVSNVKFDEPSPQYWNNLLPRIHERIEAKEQKKLFKNPIPLLWKILVPVAAVILIVIIYKILYTPETQFTQKKIDTVLEKPKNDINSELKKDNEEKQQVEKNSITKVYAKQTINRKYQFNSNKNMEKSDHKEDFNKVEQKTESSENDLIDEFASVDINNLSTITETEANGVDEELENEVDKLNSNDKAILLEELSKSDL